MCGPLPAYKGPDSGGKWPDPAQKYPDPPTGTIDPPHCCNRPPLCPNPPCELAVSCSYANIYCCGLASAYFGGAVEGVSVGAAGMTGPCLLLHKCLLCTLLTMYTVLQTVFFFLS